MASIELSLLSSYLVNQQKYELLAELLPETLF